MKAYAKQVQAEKQKERTRSKKDQISEINKLRKQRSSSGFAGELQFDKDMKVKNGVKPDRAGQRIQKGKFHVLWCSLHLCAKQLCKGTAA